MNKFVTSALLAAAVLTTGCASILNDETQPVNVSASNGKALSGSIDSAPFSGPGVVQIKRTKASKVITVDTEGCTKQTALESNVDPKFFINILTGGVLGSTTDYSTEKMWRYSESVVINCGK